MKRALEATISRHISHKVVDLVAQSSTLRSMSREAKSSGDDQAFADAHAFADTGGALSEAASRGAREADPAEVAAADARLDELFRQVAERPTEHTLPAEAQPRVLTGVAMRTAQPIGVRGQLVAMTVRGVEGTVMGELAPGVASELVLRAVESGDAVIVECAPHALPLVVGVLQTRVPETLTLRAKHVQIEGQESVVLRSGVGAMRIRRDGDVEMVGSRIATLSRGLFRIVGRVLRLN
jgi:hypothetical protein